MLFDINMVKLIIMLTLFYVTLNFACYYCYCLILCLVYDIDAMKTYYRNTSIHIFDTSYSIIIIFLVNCLWFLPVACLFCILKKIIIFYWCVFFSFIIIGKIYSIYIHSYHFRLIIHRCLFLIIGVIITVIIVALICTYIKYYKKI
jgi:hypothetical protein